MSVYNKSGTELGAVYDLSNELDYAYDRNGNIVYQKGQEALTVMTYNVGQWYIGNNSSVPSDKDAAYYELQNGILQRARADILFINEYRNPFSQAGRTALSVLEPYFPYIEERNTASGYFGRAICSKYPLSNYTTHSFSTGGGQYYDSAEVTVNGLTITLVVVHLITNPATTRWTQCQEFIAYLKTLGTFIAGGDYNTGISPNHGTDNTESEWYTKYIKSFLDEGFHSANCANFGFLVTCNDGVDGAGTDWDIDNIITSSDIEILSARVDTAKLTDDIHDKTDHMPLIATLQIGGTS